MKKYLFPLVITALISSGCAEKVVEVQAPMPTLTEWEVSGLKDVKYEVREK